MAGRDEFRIDLEAEDNASDVIEEVQRAADRLMSEDYTLALDSDVAKVVRDLEDLTSEAHATSVAAEELGRALGPELAARADTTALVGDLRDMGVSIEQVTANADQLAAKLREAADADVGGKLGAHLGTARGQIDEMSDAARGANSALANMVGNAAQDVGELGGLAGSTGVAIGQMAEYFSDAALGGQGLKSALKDMGAVVGPIAGISAAVGLVTAALSVMHEEQEAAAERTKQLGEAMESSANNALGYADVLRDNADSLQNFNAASSELFGEWGVRADALLNKIPLVGAAFGDTGEDMLQVAKAAGLSVYEMARAIEDGGAVTGDLKRQMDDALATGRISEGQYKALSEMLAEYGKNAGGAAKQLGLLNVDQAEANAMLQELTAQSAPLEHFTDLWATLFDDMADGRIDTQAAADAVNQLAENLGLTQSEVIGLAQQELDEQMRATADATAEATAAVEEYNAVLGSADWGRAALEGAARGAERFAEAQFGVVNIVSEAEAAYDDLSAAIEANGFTFDLNTEAGRANADAIQNLYASQIPAMAAAFDQADGSISAFRNGMDDLRANVMQQLREETNLTEGQIAEVIAQMGLVPGNVSSQFEMLGTEAASAKLALLSGVISSLPEDVQRTVTMAVIAGDPQAALDAIEASVAATPPTATMGLDTGPAESAAADTLGAIDASTATATIDANRTPADDARRAFERTTNATKPVVRISGNTIQAMVELMALKLFAEVLDPVVTVTADTAPAISRAWAAVNSIDRMTATVGVNARISQVPSAQDIANRIGVVRVPVDAYVRTTPRINGSLAD